MKHFLTNFMRRRGRATKAENSFICIAGLKVQIQRRAIKNLYIKICPPDGAVRVSAPQIITDQVVRQAVLNKLDWIQKHRQRLAQQKKQDERPLLNGEMHYFLGHAYRLIVRAYDGKPKVLISATRLMELYVPEYSTPEFRRRVLYNWYRRQLRILLPPLIEQWQAAFGVTVGEWRIKRMKTKWGSCNIRAARIWLNLELIKKPLQCLEYVIAHEIAHLIEPSHNKHFTALLDKHIPSWKNRKAELNAPPW